MPYLRVLDLFCGDADALAALRAEYPDNTLWIIGVGFERPLGYTGDDFALTDPMVALRDTVRSRQLFPRWTRYHVLHATPPADLYDETEALLAETHLPYRIRRRELKLAA